MIPARNILAPEAKQDTPAQNEAAQNEAARHLVVLNTIAEESADCIKVLDLGARLLSMNAGGMLTMEIDDFTVCRSLLWPDFWHGEDRVKVETALERARAGQRSVFEGQSSTFKGTPRWWEVRVAPVLGSGGVVEQLLVVSRDITERKRAEQALAELNVSLEAQVAARTRQIESQARAQDAFVTFTEAVGSETDELALTLQAIEVLLLHFPADSAGYYFRSTRASGTEASGTEASGTEASGTETSGSTGEARGDENGDVWRMQASSGTFLSGYRPPETLAADHPLVAPVVQTKQPVFIGDWSATPGRLNTAQTFGAVASVPLLIAGTVRGMLMVGLRHTKSWSERDQALARAVGRGLNLALERADSLVQLGERSRELERLNLDLGRERSFLSTVLENLSEGVVACDELGRLTLFNNATRTFHGLDASPLPPGEWAGHYDLYEGDGVTPLVTERVPLYRAWQGERLRDVELVIRPRGGQTEGAQATGAQARQLLASGQPIFTPGGQPLGAVVTMRDVTARNTAEQRLQVTVEQLQRSNAELSAANEELEAFAYSASHDLRTPVRHVQSFSELARRSLSGAPNEGAERYLGYVEQAAQRMSSLIDALLSLSRSSRQELTPAPVDLELLLRRARRDMESELAGREVQWQTSALPVVVGDQALLQQVMNNLLANAVKFSRIRQQAVIEVWSEEDAAAWTVFVRDNGAGFDPRYRERLFGVFQRLHTEREFEGTGVGLATVRRIVLRHGGNVSASSVPGEGATFGFTLPKQR